MQKDRDLNAARNLELHGLMFLISPTVADSWSETINACGEGARPLDAFQSLIGGQMMVATSVKQEVSMYNFE